jgi:hypothetical protein
MYEKMMQDNAAIEAALLAHKDSLFARPGLSDPGTAFAFYAGTLKAFLAEAMMRMHDDDRRDFIRRLLPTP